MDEKKVKEVLEYMSSLTPQEHARMFKEIKAFTGERLRKQVEDWQCQAKEMEEFVNITVGK